MRDHDVCPTGQPQPCVNDPEHTCQCCSACVFRCIEGFFSARIHDAPCAHRDVHVTDDGDTWCKTCGAFKYELADDFTLPAQSAQRPSR